MLTRENDAGKAAVQKRPFSENTMTPGGGRRAEIITAALLQVQQAASRPNSPATPVVPAQQKAAYSASKRHHLLEVVPALVDLVAVGCLEPRQGKIGDRVARDDRAEGEGALDRCGGERALRGEVAHHA